MAKDLEGKTALVTGSGRNNGRAILLELANMGANVIVNARFNAEEAEAVASEAKALGVESMVCLGDVSKQPSIDKIREEAIGRFGSVDILVNNAAVRPHQSFFDTPIEDWLEILDTQLNASFRLIKAFVPEMVEKHWGRIIQITGPDTFEGIGNRAHNVTAKGGLRAMTKALAVEFGPLGITVNDVAPGHIEHPLKHLTHPVITPRSSKPKTDEDRAKALPVRRVGTPEDVGYACGFVASTCADFFTGTVIPVFGGQLMIP